MANSRGKVASGVKPLQSLVVTTVGTGSSEVSIMEKGLCSEVPGVKQSCFGIYVGGIAEGCHKGLSSRKWSSTMGGRPDPHEACMIVEAQGCLKRRRQSQGDNVTAGDPLRQSTNVR